ncbi:hypothetical protein Ppro_3081 [Pelobacter propionicus DSM 2379]|uniref:Uncharacterized protein n=1 Tax=Pelobacter propionicus (strain DSM 2379 / NBRC 103807 / OttBd1) TaxID=338966 RepID=A1ATK6_PELPD|nr:hypothetical protein Ppro_3081 [Pelobacter propionicus DSM 2379]
MWRALSIFPFPSPTSEALAVFIFERPCKRRISRGSGLYRPWESKNPTQVSGRGLQPAVDGISAGTQFSLHGDDVAAALPQRLLGMPLGTLFRLPQDYDSLNVIDCGRSTWTSRARGASF